MKKYLFSLLAMAAVVGCIKFEDEASIDVVKPSAPTITVGTVEDTGFTATVAAQAGTGFYSYAVLAGEPKELDPATLFKVGIKNTLVSGTVDYAKNQSKTIKLEELARNAVYTVYAVAASEQGTVGEVVSQKVLTSDAQVPTPKSATFADNAFTVTFSEPVSYEGKRATAAYYAINTPSGAEYDINNDIPYGTVKVKVEASGNTAVFTLEDTVPNGAYIALSYPAGTFEDAVGNPIAAMESGFYTNDSGKLASKGIIGRQPVVNFDLTLYGDDELTSISNLISPIWINVPEDYIHFKAVTPATSEIEGYSIVYEGENETHTYTTPGPYDYGWNGTYNCALAYPNAYSGRPDPIPGQFITITIPEGFLTDIWGNKNNAFVIGPVIYSYGYTLEDVLGSYTAEVDSYFNGPGTDSFVLAASDDEEKGNIMFTTIFGDPVDEDLGVYATFDPVGGTITIPDWQEIWATEKFGGYWYFAVNGADEVVLSVPAPGTIKDTGTWFGYYVSGTAGAGWGDVYKSFTATRVEETDGEAPARAPFKGRVIRNSERVIR